MEFLVESYLEAGDLEAEARLATLEAEAGSPNAVVRHLRTTVIPEDETLLVFYEAPSADVLRAALERVGIACDRITRATTQAGSE